MIIKSVYIQNYRPYKNAEVHFATGEKNITIIEGINDAGKTSLMNAITWCLYNKEPFRLKGKEKIWNKAKFNEISVNDSFEIKVEIVMLDHNNQDIKVIHKKEFVKTSNDSCKEKDDVFIIYRDENGDDIKVPDPTVYIENNLPRSLLEYFIFTGDNLKQFMSKKTGVVKDGVHTIYQLDLVENIMKQMRKREKEYNQLFYSINPELSELKSMRSQLLEKEQEEKKTYTENEEEIERLKRENNRLWDEIGDDDKTANDIKEKLKTKENDKKDLERKLKIEKKDYFSLLINNFSIVLGYPLLKELGKWENLNIGEPEGNSGDEEYVYDIALKDLKHILKEKECLCGTKIEIDSEQYQKITNLINKIEKIPIKTKNFKNEVDTLLGVSQNLITRYPKTIKKDILSYNQNLELLENELNRKLIEIKGLNLRLESIGNDFIIECKEKITNNETLIKSYTEENALLKENIKEYPSLLREVEEDIRSAESEQEEKTEYEEKRDFCEDIKLISQKIYEELSEVIHKDLEETMTKEYRNIHWKPTYKQIIIKPNFEVDIEKTDGSVVSATDPSTGSRIVLALTFMAALNSLSGFKLPQIIDAPIANLSGVMRENVAKFLPKYMEGKQMILLVMDTEYTGSFKSDIQDYVGEKYTLKYLKEDDDEGSEQTIIIREEL